VEGVHQLNARTAMLVALLVGIGMSAQGRADADASMACVRIDDDASRLACFDRAHRRERIATPAAPAPLASPREALAGRTPDVPAARVEPAGILSRAWALDGSGTSFRLLPYRPVYVLPLSATDHINRRPESPAPGHSTGVDLPNRSVEAKFQFSAKVLAWRASLADLWIAYTQSSRWQLYQGDISRPFRETNYEPELILNRATEFEAFGWRGRTVGLALNHQSNGRALPLSRSWNRVIAHVGFERGDWSLVLRPWLRIGEPAAKDDNPDIEDHMGRADLTLRREGTDGQGLSLRLRHSLRGGERSRGAVEVEWAFPLSGRLQAFVQIFSGYGESLIDYNLRQNRVGPGFSLADWD
jgi:phospholipase A1